MASTYSALKIELLETGANSGTWGTATNVNLGDAILGEAITGQATVDFATDADVTITLTDSSTSQAARNLRLNITESSSGVGSVRNLILGSGCQIEKFYLINNTGTGAKTVKNTSGTGISVPAGKATLVFNNGTNVVDAASYFTSLTLGSALPVASGGTGITAFGSGVATFLGTPSSANLAAALTDETGSGSAVFATSPTLVTPNLGTPSTLVLSSATGLPLSSGVTGILPVANGGTATATPALVQGSGVTITGTWPNQTINATGTGGTVTAVSVASANGLAGTSSGGATPALTLSTSITGVLKGNGTAISAAVAGTDYVAINGALGTPSSGTLTNTSGLPLTSGVTGTLPVANGGTGIATATAYSVVFAGTTSTGAFQAAAGPGTATHVLTSNGACALPTFQAPASSSTANLQTFTCSGTWTKPAGITFVRVCAWGGGGGGGSGRYTGGGGSGTVLVGGGAGGGGARTSMMLPAASITATVTVTVGSGGNGGAARTTNVNGLVGTAGGTSSFGCYVRAYGGGGGAGGTSNNYNSMFGGSGGGTGGTGISTQTCVPAGLPRVNSFGRTMTLTTANTGVSATGDGAYLPCSAGGGGAYGGQYRVVGGVCFLNNPGSAEWGGGGGGFMYRGCGTCTKGCGGGSIFGGAGGGAGGFGFSSGAGIGKAGGKDQYALGGGGSGGNQAVGTAGTQSPNLSGTGGGGGGMRDCAPTYEGRAGGAGGIYGGGGGGGSGGGLTSSGAGGAGGKGAVIVYSW